MRASPVILDYWFDVLYTKLQRDWQIEYEAYKEIFFDSVLLLCCWSADGNGWTAIAGDQKEQCFTHRD